MQVFISWSGERSQKIAEVFHKWLPDVIQSVRPYFTPDDVIKGTRWETEVATVLDKSNIGLLILTPEALKSPWVLFEAGALTKVIEKSRVCPLLFGIEPTDVIGPLAFLQGAKFNKEEIKRVMKMINASLDEQGLNNDILDRSFNRCWPDLDSAVTKILEGSTKDAKVTKRSDRDILEEILLNTRETRKVEVAATSVQAQIKMDIQTKLLQQALEYIDFLGTMIDSNKVESQLREQIASILGALNFSIKRTLLLTEDKPINKSDKANMTHLIGDPDAHYR
jgi:hypothetical protein